MYTREFRKVWKGEVYYVQYIVNNEIFFIFDMISWVKTVKYVLKTYRYMDVTWSANSIKLKLNLNASLLLREKKINTVWLYLHTKSLINLALLCRISWCCQDGGGFGLDFLVL